MINQGKYLGLYEGRVTRRDDDETLGRVKLIIPGLIEPETPDWVWPFGIPGGGSAQRGHFEPPAVGATVCVFFKLGQIEHPRYIPGAWGTPDNVSDTPEGAEIEGENRQVAVTEDEEWSIQRDSRSSGKTYLIKHKSSDTVVKIDGSTGKVYLVKETATQALVRGTEYRATEAAWISAFFILIKAFATACKASTDPTLAAAATTLETGLNGIGSNDYKDDATAFLSEKAFTD